MAELLSHSVASAMRSFAAGSVAFVHGECFKPLLVHRTRHAMRTSFTPALTTIQLPVQPQGSLSTKPSSLEGHRNSCGAAQLCLVVRKLKIEIMPSWRSWSE